jgi:23S rRNA (cytidine1920-2'-O)/16S rRNA (cytidine1409-2'-O)-methyltransferase
VRKRRLRLRALVDELARVHPDLDDPAGAIGRGDVLVNGIVRTNPSSLVGPADRVSLRRGRRLRGEAKLAAGLAAFAVDVSGRVALDAGAAAGGFTRTLLAAGARRVYAVDAGHGQLLGSLRADPRVVNLEATNLGALDSTLVPEPVELVTLDLSYLALTQAVPQLERVEIPPGAHAIALVKPQFELGLAAPPDEPELLREAVRAAARAFTACGWRVGGTIESPVRGARGAVEFLLHVRRFSSC